MAADDYWFSMQPAEKGWSILHVSVPEAWWALTKLCPDRSTEAWWTGLMKLGCTMALLACSMGLAVWITLTYREIKTTREVRAHKCVDNTRTSWSRFSVHVTNAQTYLDLKVVADVATIEFRADQFKFPVKESLGVPVLVTDKVQNLLVVSHGVHTWNTERWGESVSEMLLLVKCTIPDLFFLFSF